MLTKTIYFVCPWYGSFAGGAEAATRTLAENLVLRGLDIHVLTTCCKSPFDNWWTNTLEAGEEEINGVKVRRFPVNTFGESLFHQANAKAIHSKKVSIDDQEKFIKHSINSDALISFLKNLNYEKCNVIGIPYIQGLVCSAIEALKGYAGIIPCFHDEPQFHWDTTKKLLQDSRYILFLAEEEKNLAIRHYGQLIGRRLIESPVIGVGVEVKTQDKKQNEFVFQKYNLPKKYFIYAGRKDKGKNIMKLIEYFRDYNLACHNDVKLVFIGDGDSSLIPKDKNYVDIGFVSAEDKYALISNSLGLINLSEMESFSLVIFEAWLCGVPVIVSANCEVTASHCLKSNGGLPIASREEFILALRMLEEDEALRRVLSQQGKKYTSFNYSWDRVADQFICGLNSI